eukprot:scaffold10323_cov78-Phaeocystis_antarctica.AAC.2
MPLAVVRENLGDVAKQHRLELPQHRLVRERHAERSASLNHEAAALRQLQATVAQPGDAHATPPERGRQQLQRCAVEAL